MPIQPKIPSLLTPFPTLTQPKQPLKPNSQLSYPPNFLYILTPQLPTHIHLQPFNKPLILHPHHQLNPSPFTPPCPLSSLSHI
ncbi:citrate/2-methylcitrate synthase, partial [Staphylococcus capitis]|uniref:citrate/2-methylcitrate synthase n=1 Tax=Staphylococcus capitis TaxID=29388 RepID=UPI0037094DC1